MMAILSAAMFKIRSGHLPSRICKRVNKKLLLQADSGWNRIVNN